MSDNYQFCPPEVLSPVGDNEALLGAIKGGADAVYLGVGEFNARQGAKNFTIEDLESAVDLAHSHGVLVYLALNIPIKQKELQHALEIVDRAYAIGVDAIILQDLGLLRLLKEIYPDLALHASTQMTIHNKEGVDFATELGTNRVIVSRELTTAEVKDIVEHSKVGIEVFVHGALCYSYSGKCLFSSFLHDRSANRGACAQPCRRRYSFLVNGREIDERHIGGSYPISCAELSTLTGLKEIVKTGVVSLKIEGRMKKPEYVTASASAYKAAVEAICGPGANPTKEELETRESELAKLFYRGFTRGFILGEKGVSHPKYSSNYGAFLGKVLDLSRSKGSTKLTVRLEGNIQVKDGISIFTRERMLGSAVAGIVTISGEHVKSARKGEKVGLEISSKTGRAVRRGDELYLTTDTQLLDTLQKTKLKALPVSLKAKARKGERFKVEIRTENRKSSENGISAENGNTSRTEEPAHAEFADDYIVQEAEKAPTTVEQIKKVMESLGDTPFKAASIEIEADENIFIPVGVLKNTRRKAAELLLEKTLKVKKKEQKHPDLGAFDSLCSLGNGSEIKIESGMKRTGTESRDTRSTASKKVLLSVEVQKISSLIQAAEAGADIAYIPLSLFEELMSPKNEEKLEDLKAERIELVFRVPRITHDSELVELRPLLEKIRDAGFTIACSSLGASRLAKELSIPFVAQKDLNIFNAFTASTFFQTGAYRATLSSELNLSEIKNVCEALQACGNPGQTEILAYGRELMLITENDLLKPLVDRRIVRKESEVLLVDQSGSEFPVQRLGTRTLIYNSKVLDILKYVRNMKGYGVDVLRLDLSLNTGAEVKEITEAYKEALAGKEAKLKPARGVEYTTGHYFKGV
ncbi:peptidase, U32 family large subunit (C1) [Methanosarcina siciliae C2J]|uniref:Peptidase, U32 family large subunit (C1) n=1 Tax=Methanosarcina siciliae C2J TaxID=1434118 RepID=A0A0E3LDR1_9EURY|nr:U32 family peptidase [Methanosarcina siciliae]AKB37711.1 peptidase, U32 family large subunit (C1) [Methanosarcina siciliae C2J]